METDPFKRSTPESSSAHDDVAEDSSSKKKKKARNLPLSNNETESKKANKNDMQEKAEKIEDASTLWRKLINQTTETTADSSAKTKEVSDRSDEKTKEIEEAAKKAEQATAKLGDEDKAAQTEMASEYEAPLETLSSEERTAVAAEYIAARRAEILAELARAEETSTEDDEAAAAERTADLALLDAMQHMLERNTNRPSEANGELSVDEPISEAYAATAQRLAELLPETETDDAADESMPEQAEPQPQDFPLHEVILNAEREEDEPDDQTVVSGTATPAALTGQPGNATGIGGGQGSHGPQGPGNPRGPSGPYVQAPRGGGPFYGGGFGSAGGNGVYPRPNVAPTPAAAPTIEVIDNRRNHTGSALLVGAVVGYLIGRRRGRIKTEKRLKTVEKKLTREVEAARQQVAEKEQQIRKLARETYQQKHRKLTYEAPPFARPEGKSADLSPMGAATQRERSVMDSRTEIGIEQSGRQIVTPTERLGLGLVTLRAAEALPVTVKHSERASEVKSLKKETEITAEKLARMPRGEGVIPKTSATMGRAELLQAGSEVRVGTTNLRRVYETNLISEQGLRRLLAVHERGGNVREVLQQELKEKEMSYERDPRLRNRSRSMMGAMASSAVVRAEIDQPAGVSSKTNDRHADTDNPTGGPKESSRQSSQKVTVMAGAGIAIILAILLYLLFTGKSL